MTAKETLKHVINSDGLPKGVYFSKIKNRLLKKEDGVTEDYCNKILIELGYKMIQEPKYKKVK